MFAGVIRESGAIYLSCYQNLPHLPSELVISLIEGLETVLAGQEDGYLRGNRNFSTCYWCMIPYQSSRRQNCVLWGTIHRMLPCQDTVKGTNATQVALVMDVMK